MGNKKPEQRLQIGVFSNLTPLMHLQKYQQFLAFQIRNETGVGGAKGAMIGAFAKAMGTMEGVSDVIALFPNEVNGYSFPITEFWEFKVMRPLKTKERDPESLLSDAQKRFKKRVEDLGFKYRIIAAENVNQALEIVYGFLRQNGVNI